MHKIDGAFSNRQKGTTTPNNLLPGSKTIGSKCGLDKRCQFGQSDWSVNDCHEGKYVLADLSVVGFIDLPDHALVKRIKSGWKSLLIQIRDSVPSCFRSLKYTEHNGVYGSSNARAAHWGGGARVESS
jgi:hypothetical protein